MISDLRVCLLMSQVSWNIFIHLLLFYKNTYSQEIGLCIVRNVFFKVYLSIVANYVFKESINDNQITILRQINLGRCTLCQKFSRAFSSNPLFTEIIEPVDIPISKTTNSFKEVKFRLLLESFETEMKYKKLMKFSKIWRKEKKNNDQKFRVRTLSLQVCQKVSYL